MARRRQEVLRALRFQRLMSSRTPHGGGPKCT